MIYSTHFSFIELIIYQNYNITLHYTFWWIIFHFDMIPSLILVKEKTCSIFWIRITAWELVGDLKYVVCNSSRPQQVVPKQILQSSQTPPYMINKCKYVSNINTNYYKLNPLQIGYHHTRDNHTNTFLIHRSVGKLKGVNRGQWERPLNRTFPT